jgi:cation diffusion facilitator CzcD-associated flavoprotein CzcO
MMAETKQCPETRIQNEHFDVLIVGAGFSGRRCLCKRFLILEGRETIGGLKDLFRYRGLLFSQRWNIDAMF